MSGEAESGRPGAGYALMALAVGLFSTVEVATKSLGGAVPPLRLAFYRFFFTGLALTPAAAILWRRAGRRIGGRDLLLLSGIGVIGVTVAIGLFHLAMNYLQANVAAVIFSVNPVVVALLAPMMLREKLTRRTLAGAAVGALGVAAFVGDADGVSARTATGVLMMLGSVLGFALYTVMVKRYAPRYGAIEITGVASLMGGLLLLPLSLWREGVPWGPLSVAQGAGVLYLTAVATALAYVCYFLGLGRVDASRGAMFFFLKPVLASCFAGLLLGEPFTRRMAVGTAFILVAMFLALVPGRHRRDAASPAA
jgi:drug/metabolite transporter (DMT)-like permease